MSESLGYIKLFRKLMDSPIYFSETFCRNMAWVDLLMLTNHTTGFFRARGILVTVNRGQCGWSLEQLASRWKWSRGKAERFMKELEKDGKIVRQKSNVTTLISIINYDTYQGDGKANGKADGQQTVKQTDANNNEKEFLKTKRIKAFTPPDEEDVFKYFRSNSLSEQQSKSEATKFVNYYASKGWLVGKSPMKNWEAAASGWLTRFFESQKINYAKTGTGVQISGPTEQRNIFA